MKKKQQHIPHFNLSDLARGGIFIYDMEDSQLLKINHEIHLPHRDHHFLLIILRAGYVDAIVDFERVTLLGPAVGMIFPGQVHQVEDHTHLQGYTISFEPSVIPPTLQNAFEQPQSSGAIWTGDAALLQQVFTLAAMLFQLKAAPPHTFTNYSIQALLHALLGLLAGAPAAGAVTRATDKRGEKITQQFLQLLQQHFRDWKRPAAYALAMAITTSHLNDCVRAETGFSVSYHLQQAMILEAKRLLTYTGKSVKEITYELGLDDHGYFSRLFKKVAGQTPLQFRAQLRD